MEYRVLGPLEVIEGGHDVVPSAPKLRAVLAFLVLQHDRGVRSHELIDELWGEKPPTSALPTVQTYIYKLRKILRRDHDPVGGLLQSTPYGYCLTIPNGELDLSSFEHLMEDGRLALGSGDPGRATRLLSQALSLWRGRALANVGVGEILSAHVIRLEEIRLRALEMRVDADLALGRHHALVSELKALVPGLPLHEGFHAKLMTALYRSGRRYEALDVFQRLRAFLIKELGLEPSSELQRLHQALLSSDPSLDPSSLPTRLTVAADPPAPAGLETRASPAQLPPDITDFSGRSTLICQLEDLLVPGGGGNGAAVPVVAIAGPPGSGKTALAIHVAHLLETRFQGGQFIAHLGGTGDEPADPLDLLGGFLQAAGFQAGRIPADLGGRSRLFRSWCADRDVLTVLDDAASSVQIEPLIPGNGHCAVIVTSRAHTLDGTRPLPLGLMDHAEGMELLTSIVGNLRVDAEPGAAKDLVDLCGGLPVALRAAAARLAASPSWPLGKLARRLAEPRSRLDELRLGDLDVRSCYESSYQRLDAIDQSAFRLLSLLRLPHFNAAQAGELLGCDDDDAESLLDRLVEGHLLTAMNQNGAQISRYVLPELTRIYAQERLEQIIRSD